MQHLFALHLLALLLDFVLRDLRALNQRADRIDLLLNLLSGLIIHAHNLELPVNVVGIARDALGPNESQHCAARSLGREKPKERIMLEIARTIHQRAHVIHHAVDLIVEQGVGRQRRGLDLRVRKHLQLVARVGVNNRNLYHARALIRLVNRKGGGELRKAVSPFHA